MHYPLLTSVLISLLLLGCHPRSNFASQTSSAATVHDVVLYSSQSCLYCTKIKELLDARGVSYRVIDVMQNPLDFQHAMKESGQTTVPQVFVDGRYIGGYKTLALADMLGNLEDKIRGN